MRNNTKAPSLARKGRLTDAKLLLIITSDHSSAKCTLTYSYR